MGGDGILRRLRPEDQEFEANLGLHSKFKATLSYIARSCLKKAKQKSPNNRNIFSL
jgi:hypothetical protein